MSGLKNFFDTKVPSNFNNKENFMDYKSVEKELDLYSELDMYSELINALAQAKSEGHPISLALLRHSKKRHKFLINKHEQGIPQLGWATENEDD